MHIGILEDDPIQRRFLVSALKDWDEPRIQCDSFERASELLKAMSKQTFDLLILDWFLPDADGMQLMKRLRQDLGWPGPVLFITASQGENDVVMALESGADDFLTKPIRPAELRARIFALARRAGLNKDISDATQAFGAYTLAPSHHTITVNNTPVELTAREYELAALFLSHLGQLFSRQNILEMVWGVRADLSTRTIDTHISRLRKKLSFDGTYGLQLKSVYKYGYRLEHKEVAV
ncbi:response regulator transcription factor [Halomonas sp. GFAJ-1]|uniref:response regulator transcription factor n=1 Tax=Halomonas sp. GFAJ-1 TaxID=1118153 RepID=UPI00023A5969|nr:response regulator transcription factor [Halomonas sp. GFAJ-1]AVI61503.1 DNA-binding response regulator [Halomonas sp. GFAJ-1]EHK61849.1 two component transcriptional regulator [Halomonas sp. GFAJ-1]